MRIDEHKRKAFKLVGQIGALARVDNATLYTHQAGYWRNLTADCITNKITGPYGFGTQGNRFLIAGPNQDGVTDMDNMRNPITSFILFYFPGCCALCISSGTRVYHPYLRLGVNKLGLQLRMALAGAYNYKALVCTDKATNIASIRTIEGAGFNKLCEVKNKRTENLVNLYIKEIP